MEIQENVDQNKGLSSTTFLIIEIVLGIFIFVIWSSLIKNTEFFGIFSVMGILMLTGIIGMVIAISNLSKKRAVLSSILLIILSLSFIFALGIALRFADELDRHSARKIEKERLERIQEYSLDQNY